MRKLLLIVLAFVLLVVLVSALMPNRSITLTASAAVSDSDKAKFLSDVRDWASQWNLLNGQAHHLQNQWILRTYIGNGAKTITDEEAATIGLTASQLQTGVNLMGQVNNLNNGSTVTASNQYQVFVINAGR